MDKVKNDKGQRTTRTRSAPHAARSNKGFPKKQARIKRAQERLALHVYNPNTCKKGCLKKPKTSEKV